MPLSGSGSGPPDGFWADQAPSSVSEGDDGLAQHKPPASTGDERTVATTAIADKTIACTLCRGRKLKCDRAKPKCGTCTRLRSNCEYPERRRTVGSKRRNMKDLEARLGASRPFLRLLLSSAQLMCRSSGRNETCIRNGKVEGFRSNALDAGCAGRLGRYSSGYEC
jgi:hypothetical protein